MLKYIRNEWMKLWARKSTWTMLALTILLAIVPAFVMKYTEDDKDWRTYVQEETNMYKSMLAEDGLAAEDAAYFQEQIALNEYRLAEDIPLAINATFDGYVSYGVGLIIMVTIFSVVVAAGIVSSEFSTGTIKMLLTRPVSRTKILLSKLLTVILFGLFLYAVCLAGSSLIALLLWGTDTSRELQMVDGVIKEIGVWKPIFEKFILSFGDFFMSIFFAFMLGSIFRSSSLAIGLTLVISMMGALIITLMSKYGFAKYVWISHSDLTQHVSGGTPYIEGVTLPFSLTVLAVYAILFVLSSFIIFNKRDVTA